MYRSLTPGEQGPDVAELQQALISLGYSIGQDTIGTFGNGTKTAVSDYYHNIGFPITYTGNSGKIYSLETSLTQYKNDLANEVSQEKKYLASQNLHSYTPTFEQGATNLVITGIDKPAGSVVKSGELIASISRRPLFFLQGNIPMYRSLTPGEQGPDVAELQKDLISLGYSIGQDKIGTFGDGTKTAISAYYHHIGFSPIFAGSPSAIEQDQQTLQSDETNLLTLENQLYQSTTTTTSPPGIPTTTAANASGNTGVTILQTQISAAQQSVANDKQSLASAELSFGPEVQEQEAIFLPCARAKVVSLSGSIGDQVTSPFVSLKCLSDNTATYHKRYVSHYVAEQNSGSTNSGSPSSSAPSNSGTQANSGTQD